MQLFTIGLWDLNADGTPVRDGSGELVPSYKRPMVAFEERHDQTEKVLFAGKPWQVTMPAGGSTDQDVSLALDALFNHPKTPVYFAQRFIQYMVTSTPSPAYIRRSVMTFATTGKDCAVISMPRFRLS